MSTRSRLSKPPRARSRRSRLVFSTLALVIAIAASAAADPHAEGDLSSYAYVEVLDGRGQVEHSWGDAVEELETHYPLLAGDRITLEPGTRLALILPDRTRVRLSGPADVTLERLALAREESSSVSEIELREGELQIVVDEDFLADELPILTTHAGGFLLHEPGEYVFYTDGDWTAATPRSGFLELSTERGSAIVRAGETLTVEGTRWPRLSTRLAEAESSLETWASALDDERVAYGSAYVDRSLWHSSAPLERHGTWVQVGGRHAWHPRASDGWRPYYDGRWVPTPSGYTWVSSEPWGWLTYHYGTWDFSTGLGWLWYPGRVYSPAWVYWHWSPSYVGWVPTGYYSGHYGGLHLGIHGWSKASWSTYSYWNFCRTRDVGRNDFRGHVTTGAELSRTARLREVPRGIVTTDTRPVDPRHLDSPEELPERIARTRGAGSAELIDVSGFVARRDVPNLLDGRIHTRAAAPRSRPGTTSESGRSSSLSYRAPVLRSRVVPSRPDDGPRTSGAPSARAGTDPRSRMRFIAPDRAPGRSPDGASDRAGARSGVSYPPAGRVPRLRAPSPSEPAPNTPTGITSAAPRDPSMGPRVLERIRSHREAAPPARPSSPRSGTESKPPPEGARSSTTRAAPPSRSAPPPKASQSNRSSSSSRKSTSRSSNRSSGGSSDSSARSESGSRSSSARSTRPPKQRDDR